MHAIRACWVILLAIGGKKSMLDAIVGERANDMLLYLMVRLVGFREHRTLNAIISSMIYTALQMHHAW